MEPTKKQGKVAGAADPIVQRIPVACADEAAAVDFFEETRWGEGCKDAFCPKCGSVAVYKMTDSKGGGRNRFFRWRCRDCKQQFTVRTGTVYEESRIPLRHWAFAFWAACASKKGVSAKQIQRQTGLSYKSALFLMHRIRWAMRPENPDKLTGTVEADETWVGGKPRYRYKNNPKNPFDPRTNNHQNRFTRHKPVFAAVQRNGEVRCRVLPQVNAENLHKAVLEHIDLSARLMTDEHSGYTGVGKKFAGGHDHVPHKALVYARGDVTTNTVEGFFSILKRGINGTFHAVSHKHLQRYLDEFEFRYNARKMSDGDRTAKAIQQAEGKRLTYREPTVKPA